MIDKLDDDNYSAWAVQMKSVQWTTRQKKKNSEKDEKAITSIMLCVKTSQVNHISIVKPLKKHGKNCMKYTHRRICASYLLIKAVVTN